MSEHFLDGPTVNIAETAEDLADLFDEVQEEAKKLFPDYGVSLHLERPYPWQATLVLSPQDPTMKVVRIVHVDGSPVVALWSVGQSMRRYSQSRMAAPEIVKLSGIPMEVHEELARLFTAMAELASKKKVGLKLYQEVRSDLWRTTQLRVETSDHRVMRPFILLERDCYEIMDCTEVFRRVCDFKKVEVL